MPFTIVVVTPLITIMKDQVEHLNKIGVVAAMMGEDVAEAVKSGSCEIVYCNPKSWLPLSCISSFIRGLHRSARVPKGSKE